MDNLPLNLINLSKEKSEIVFDDFFLNNMSMEYAMVNNRLLATDFKDIPELYNPLVKEYKTRLVLCLKHSKKMQNLLEKQFKITYTKNIIDKIDNMDIKKIEEIYYYLQERENNFSC
jgi:hypothetical protein